MDMELPAKASKLCSKIFMGTARLVLLRFKNSTSNSTRLLSSHAAVVRRPWTRFNDGCEHSDGESAVYRRALKFQQPTTVNCQNTLHNYVSLIGTIEFPLRPYKCEIFGVLTRLKVKASTGAHRHFGVLLKFRDEMAEISLQHLKPCDLIYVSGRLESYTKENENGKSKHYYEVVVTDVNFVAQHDVRPACQNLVKLEPKFSTEDIMQMHRARLHLWQVFFANPFEWWDNRNSKLYPYSPDFKHKDTGEKLCLKDSDPPWIKQQLRLHDSRLSKRSSGGFRNAWSHLSPLVYNDAKGT